VISRVVRSVQRHGLGSTAGRALDLAVHRVVLDEEHVWYDLPLTDLPTAAELGDGLEIVRQPPLHVLDDAGVISQDDAAALTPDGDPWAVVDGDGMLAFTCWTFLGRTPMIAARGGWLPLPQDVVCLENSLTQPAFRGRGIAPRAWSLIAARHAAEGRTQMVTKVEVENVPSRRAVEKAGFKEVGLMHFRRRPWGSQTTISLTSSSVPFLQTLAKHADGGA
jgi:GNAT superfamily N-acetyltransferase